MPVSTFVTVTVAPGITACLASITLPLIAPAPDVCAMAEAPVNTTERATPESSAARWFWVHHFLSIIASLKVLHALGCLNHATLFCVTVHGFNGAQRGFNRFLVCSPAFLGRGNPIDCD